MTRISIARSLLMALVGLTIALAVVAGLSVSALYEARQRYEERLSTTYAAEVATANLLAAGVVEETVLRGEGGDAAARERTTATFAQAAQAARDAARGDSRSEQLVGAIAGAEAAARAAAGRLRRARRDDDAAAQNDALGLLADAFAQGRRAAGALSARQAVRRKEARDAASSDSQSATTRAVAAGALALFGAVALVALLVAGVRGPLERLVVATRRLAAGDLKTRVQSEGPAEIQELSSAFNDMAADLDAARNRIEAARLQLAATIESLGDGLVICDGHGVVTQVNPRAGDLVPEIQPGHSLARDPGPLPELATVLDREAEIEHFGRSLSVTAARMGPSREDGVVFTVRDVTERARLERAKSEFVSTASHELRSPLTSIKGFVELLAAGELTERQREFTDVIMLSTNRLVDLVSDLLDVARVEAGQLEIQRRPIAVSEAVEEVVTLMRPRVEAKAQVLEVEVAPALPAASADPGRVRQIVSNLLTNAHLYTPEGGRITIRVGASGEHVTLAISDTGRGMSRDQVDRLFDRFYRADGRAASESGTGLGMSIVRSLVDLHEGEIEVESELGRGTTITVRLPRAPAASDLAEPREAIQGKRVLVVDDEPEVARLIAEQLRPFEVEVVIVNSGKEALSRLRRQHFDAVTLDIFLGDQDGFEVLRELREDPELSRTPVIVVSVLAGEEALAGEWSVSKPIDAEELTDAIGSAILAGRARVLVVGRASMRDEVGEMLSRRGIDFVWATSAAEAARLCEERRFEVALVDAGMRSPQAALAQLDLRGRRLRRSVVVFSTGDESPGIARLDPDPMTVEDATQAVVEALRSTTGR
jgi:signal transduction histidine kinase/DNA-binding response OmpR family regulator/HAMP domain-containing protein